MCGIWGLFSKQQSGMYPKDLATITQMMRITADRGMDSTGIAVTNFRKPKMKAKVWKTVGGPCYLIQNKAWEEIDNYTYKEGGAAFGHGRYATKGNITGKNAHPFSYKHLTIVHNGTIHSGLSYEKVDNQEIEVDSHALCIKMADAGIKEALLEVSGAFAIIAHDQNNQCIWFARNYERPLSIAETTDRVFLMSDRDALEYILRKNGYPNAHIKFVDSNQLFKFDLNKYEVTREESIAKPYTHNYANNYSGYQGGGSWAGWENPAPKDHYHRIYSKEEKEVKFLVLSVEKAADSEYVYKGETEDGEKVEFRTSVHYPDFISRIGTGRALYEVIRAGNVKTLFLKYRDIIWDGDDKVKTLNGLVMTKEKWDILCKTEPCIMCGEKIEKADTTLLNDKGPVCELCVSHLQTGDMLC